MTLAKQAFLDGFGEMLAKLATQGATQAPGAPPQQGGIQTGPSSSSDQSQQPSAPQAPEQGMGGGGQGLGGDPASPLGGIAAGVKSKLNFTKGLQGSKGEQAAVSNPVLTAKCPADALNARRQMHLLKLQVNKLVSTLGKTGAMALGPTPGFSTAQELPADSSSGMPAPQPSQPLAGATLPSGLSTDASQRLPAQTMPMYIPPSPETFAQASQPLAQSQGPGPLSAPGAGGVGP